MKWHDIMTVWISASLLAATSMAQAEGLLELSAGIHLIQAEVANTYDTRAEGLMSRKSMPANHGMLFVFDQTAQHCMWMRNTLIPLSVAFLDGEGRIINAEEMQPQTDDTHCASRPAKFALEMNAAWFKNKGFGAGSQMKGIDKAPTAR
jgi:uncharacterized membrane protein (UPF0127 family)